MTPNEWNAVLAPHNTWQNAYAAVEEEVRELLNNPGARPPYSTSELVEELYPAASAKGEGITARKRIFTALAALAKHGLKDYCEAGEPRPLKHNRNRLVTPLIWRAPKPKATIQRYELDHDMMECSPEGDWVRWEDVRGLL